MVEGTRAYDCRRGTGTAARLCGGRAGAPTDGRAGMEHDTYAARGMLASAR